jgi:hypothetical protein
MTEVMRRFLKVMDFRTDSRYVSRRVPSALKDMLVVDVDRCVKGRRVYTHVDSELVILTENANQHWLVFFVSE